MATGENVNGKAAAVEEEKRNETEDKGGVSESTLVEKSSTMAIEQKLQGPQKDKVVPHSDEQVKKPSKDIQDKGVEIECEAEKVGLGEKKKDDKVEKGDASSESTNKVEKSSSFREESNFLSDLKEHEKKALMELRWKIEDAILENKLFKGIKDQTVRHEKEKSTEKEGRHKEKIVENESKGEENSVKEAEDEKEISKKVEEVEEKENILEKEGGEKEKINEGKQEENAVKEKETSNKKVEEIEVAKPSLEEKSVVKEEREHATPSKQEDEEKEKKAEEGQNENNRVGIDEDRKVDVINKDIAIWGVPLLPSKGDSRTDVILLKFLRAREFEVLDAFKMLKNTLQWRKNNNVDSILDEDFGEDLGSIGHMNGVGREGHPVCYNNFKLLANEKVYNKIVGTEENREMFIRRRVQLMEKAIQKLDFKPGGVSSILLVNDLKDMPGPSRKELRLVTNQVVGLLQDNYPEFVTRNIFINVPFWYYAYSASALLLPFLTPRTNSKVVYARPSRVTEVLLKYIAAEKIPLHYGGLKRENDSEFSAEDAASEIIVNPSSSESIQLPSPEAETTLNWDVTVLGWEVNYKEEFFPTNEGSYGIIIQKGRRVGSQEGSLRNSFTSKEPGNVVLTVENGSLIKKKRVCYRYKTKNSSSS